MTSPEPPILTQSDFDNEEEYQEYLAIENANYTDEVLATEEDKSKWKALADEQVKLSLIHI